MTRRRDVATHLLNLEEIRQIIAAMRNLALLETRKLARALRHHSAVMSTMRRAMGDLLSSFPDLAERATGPRGPVILVGSERGFCGDFNRRLLEAVPEDENGAAPALVAVGEHLAARLPRDLDVHASLSGATTVEEVPEVLIRLMHELDRWRADSGQAGPRCPVVVYHDADGAVKVTALDPAGDADMPGQQPGYPPGLNLDPAELLEVFTGHYLYALLYEVFYGSLLAENDRRQRHMERALHSIDEQCENLRRRENALRQEEITEEIEVITLTTGALEEAAGFSARDAGPGK
ncbi:MAG: F0F1 ATP synthase subunit gamma [Gammaproteobacteria bacterium]